MTTEEKIKIIDFLSAEYDIHSKEDFEQAYKNKGNIEIGIFTKNLSRKTN